jgi:hypothetical protein
VCVCPSPLEQTGKREEENRIRQFRRRSPGSILAPIFSLSPFYAQAQKGRDYLLSNIEPLSLLAYYTRTWTMGKSSLFLYFIIYLFSSSS